MAQIDTLTLNHIVRPQDVIPDFAVQDHINQAAQLLGYNAMANLAHPGDTLRIPLVWKARVNWYHAGKIAFRLIDKSNLNKVQETMLPFAPFAETEHWRAGEAFWKTYPVKLRRDLDGGYYTLQVALNAQSIQDDISPWIDIADINVSSWPRRFTPPHLHNITNITFDDKIKLYGYEIDQSADASYIQVELCWETLSEMDTSYTLFLQLLNHQDRLVAQIDTIPGDGAYPTTAWLKGEYICDTLILIPDEKLPKDDYTIITGFYDSRSEQRISIKEPQNGNPHNAAILTTITIQDN